MRSPSSWLEVDEVESTQTEASRLLLEGSSVEVVFAHNQTRGRGRFDRRWQSNPGESLTVSMIFREYANHPSPYLIGMSVAIAAASELHVQLRWPNDLCLQGRKLGGVLTEVLAGPEGQRVPVVGLGLNLNQQVFGGDLSGQATSVLMQHGTLLDARQVCKRILAHLKTLPEPNAWSDLAPIWSLFDDTPGKKYTLADGKVATALGVGPMGELLCAVDGEAQTVLAADAIFGS